MKMESFDTQRNFVCVITLMGGGLQDAKCKGSRVLWATEVKCSTIRQDMLNFNFSIFEYEIL
jgi:hypothetical protein